MDSEILFESMVQETFPLQDGVGVVLEHTLFAPDGAGGQLGDRGKLGDQPVLRVFLQEDGRVVHVVPQPVPLGKNISCSIDGARRKDIAAQHTAQHLLSADLFNQFGFHTVGFQMGERVSTIDVDRLSLEDKEGSFSRALDLDFLKPVEELIFEQVEEDLPVNVLQVPVSELHRYPLRKPLSPKYHGLPTVRLVQIGNLDFSLCGGHHLSRLGQLHLVKAIKTERIKGNWTRIHFLAGKRALFWFQEQTCLVDETTTSLSTSSEELGQRIKNILEDQKNSRHVSRRLSESLAQAMYQNFQVRKQEKTVKGWVQILPSEEAARGLLQKLNQEENAISMLLFEQPKGNGYILSSTRENIDARSLFSRLKNFLNIKGGGNEKIVRGTVEGNLEAVKHQIESFIENIDTEGE
ncbi:MAG TPA: alanyl-tRNA editing protein [Thermotogota bacterium]|nr:alanyl-tRNA editing protein [Thermotogota bacterium]HRW92383.1 alanyl-tRNA editing protein [Thermotogota bacterium]